MWEVPVTVTYPFTTPPVAAETTSSYIGRLAEMNGMDEYLALTHIALCGTYESIRTNGWHHYDFALNPLAAQRLAAVSGYPLDTLHRTLSFRNLWVHSKHRRDVPIAQGHLLKRVLTPPWNVMAACPRCSAARGLTTRPQIVLAPGRLVCLRHGFWLADQPQDRPLKLDEYPGLEAAAHRFLRLRRKDAERADKAIFAAYQLWSQYRYGAHPHRSDVVQRIWQRRENAWGWVVRDPSLTLRFPEIVALTEMICSRYWVQATSRPFTTRTTHRPRPDQRDFLLEVGRRIGHPRPDVFSTNASSVSSWLRRVGFGPGGEKERLDWRTLVMAAPG